MEKIGINRTHTTKRKTHTTRESILTDKEKGAHDKEKGTHRVKQTVNSTASRRQQNRLAESVKPYSY